MDASRTVLILIVGGGISTMIILLLVATGAFGEDAANRFSRLADRWGSTTPREVSRADTIRTVREAAALYVVVGFVMIAYAFFAPPAQEYTWAAKAFGPGVFLVIGGAVALILTDGRPGQVDRQEDRPR